MRRKVPLKSGIAVCSAMLRDSYQRPMRLRQVKRDPAVFRKYLDGSQMRRLTLQLSILLLFLMTEPGHSQKN